MATNLITLVLLLKGIQAEELVFPLRKETLCHKNGLFSNEFIEKNVFEWTDISLGHCLYYYWSCIYYCVLYTVLRMLRRNH